MSRSQAPLAAGAAFTVPISGSPSFATEANQIASIGR